MTSDQLSAAAGVALSLAFSYVPGLRDRFAALSGEHKRIGMLAALLIVTLGSFGLTCGGLLGSTAIQCNRAGAIDLLWAFVAATIANQAAFLISPKVDTK